MQTERVTFLASPETKATLSERAAARGISVGEYIRRRVEDDEELTPEQEAELAALVKEVNVAIPQMAEMLDQMSQNLRETHQEVDRMLREAGIRK